MESKLIAIIDDATEIPALALRQSHVLIANERDRYIMALAGFGRSLEQQQTYVMLCNLHQPSTLRSDPLTWPNRTMHAAHHILINHWESFVSGDTLDVRSYHDEFSAAIRRIAHRHAMDEAGI